MRLIVYGQMQSQNSVINSISGALMTRWSSEAVFRCLLEKAVEPEKKRKLVSFVDSEARFGTKSKKTKFAGYKAHVAEDESQIITSVQTILGDENEGNGAHLESMLEKEDEKGLIAEAVVCDALYDTLSNRLNITKRGIKHYIPQEKKEEKVK